MGGVTLCFSNNPHFARSSGCPRSLCGRLWTAFRMDDIATVVYVCVGELEELTPCT